MIRAALLAALIAGSFASAEDRPARLRPADLEVGQVGAFVADTGKPFAFRVVQVLEGRRLLLGLKSGDRVVARNVDTDGIADGKEYPLLGVWKVSGVEKIGARTYYAVEPVGNK